MNTNKLSFTYGGDSMGHIMKGNIGLFISAGEDISIENLDIHNIETKKNKVGSSIFIDYTHDDSKLGLLSCGCCITGSNNIKMTNENIDNIKSENGSSIPNKEINSDVIQL